MSEPITPQQWSPRRGMLGRENAWGKTDSLDKWWIKYTEIMTALKLDSLQDRGGPSIISYLIKACPEQPLRDLNEFIYTVKRRVGNTEKLIVAGPGPSLERIKELLNTRCVDCPIISADSSFYKIIRNVGHDPQIVVTDLDGIAVNDFDTLMEKGVIAAVHLHGDNYRSIIPVFWKFCNKNILFTTQIKTQGPLTYHIKGFTDGDRAIFLALSLKPKRIFLVGMDYDLQPLPNGLTTNNIDYTNFFKLKVGKSIATYYICKARAINTQVSVLSYFSINCPTEG